jgi:hypothetical protein
MTSFKEEMVVPEHCRGREQAFVKHRLLEAYLGRLFMVIGQPQSQIRYVACPSWPWQGEDSIQTNLAWLGICHRREIATKRWD